MWPLLFASAMSVAVVIERFLFIFRERKRRNPDVADKILSFVEEGNISLALQLGHESEDFVVRTLSAGLAHRGKSFATAVLRQAGWELKRFDRGLPILDTIITLAPLLGLLGTVTGMIHAFGLLGASELEAPAAITGGIAEALIATAFGLGIAIVSLIPFNYLNARLEEARREIEDASNQLELLLINPPAKAENVYENITASR